MTNAGRQAMTDDTYTCPCHDCGRDTIPVGGPHEWYMVHDELWAAAGMANDDGRFLCIVCLERRLGRQLNRADFTNCPVNMQKRWGSRSWLLRKRLRRGRDRKSFETTPLGRWK